MLKKLILIWLIPFIGLFAACEVRMTHRERIEANTGMIIPIDAIEEYYSWILYFSGEYSLYAVYKFDEKPAEFLKEHSFEAYRQDVVYSGFKNVRNHIPEEYLGNIKGEFMGNNKGSYYFLETNRLVISKEQS